jgi:hypothetical protein
VITGREFVDMLVRTGYGTPDTIMGCTEGEIRHLEQTVGLALPEKYKDFLRAAGKCAGGYNTSSDWLYPELLAAKKEAVELLNLMEHGRLSLPEKAFVCAMDTEGFAFFETGEPLETGPIFSYYEEDGHFTRAYDSFWDMVETELTEHSQHLTPILIESRHDSALKRVRRFRKSDFLPLRALRAFARILHKCLTSIRTCA